MVKLQLPPPVEELTVTVCGEPATEKNEPDTGKLVTPPQSPVGSISPEKSTIAPGSPLCVVLAETVRFNGQVKTQVGDVVPAARISNLASALLVSGWGSVVVLVISTSDVLTALAAPELTV
jgi:hypothetical protein